MMSAIEMVHSLHRLLFIPEILIDIVIVIAIGFIQSEFNCNRLIRFRSRFGFGFRFR